MTDTPPSLRPASRDELIYALSYGMRFEGRRRIHHAEDFMARVAAEKLVAYLEQSGFVVMKKPPARDHSASNHPHPHRE